jgi:CelD/BcsL family acetyltransferase involved in cellulose biosynthesis
LVATNTHDSLMKQDGLNLDPPFLINFADDRWRCPEFRASWARLMERRANHDALDQSPPFWEHLYARIPEKLSILTVHAAGDTLAGVVPLRKVRWPLAFDVSGRVLAQATLDAIVILGSQPLMPSDPVLHDRLYATIDDSFPECEAIAMPSVPAESFLWRYCLESRVIKRHFLVYIPYGKRLCHTMSLAATFEQYLAKLSHKKRYNLNRQVRKLREFAGGSLELRCIDRPEDVPMLIEAVSAIKRQRHRNPLTFGSDDLMIDRNEFRDFAARGILLSYVLFCGTRPCAVTMGTRYERTYGGLHRIAYDHSLEALSPGSTMLFLVIEDLIRRHQIELIDFGYGEPAHRQHSTNVLVERGTILLLRKTLANRLRRTGHASFHTAIGLLKQLLSLTWGRRAEGGPAERDPRNRP